MDVRVTDVKKWAGRQESVHLSEPWPTECQSRVDFPLPDKAELDVLVRNTGGSLIVELSGQIRADVQCSRCLEPFHMAIPFDAVEEFREESGIDDPDLDYFRFTGDKIKLDRIVADSLGVSVPMVAICRPDCAGLCPVCGCNRNVVECHCNVSVDNRWQALQKLKLKD